MPDFNLVYDTKAQKQFDKLDADTQRQIELDIAGDTFLFDKDNNLRGVGSQFTGNFWRVSSGKYRILVHVEPGQNRIVVMDVSLGRFA